MDLKLILLSLAWWAVITLALTYLWQSLLTWMQTGSRAKYMAVAAGVFVYSFGPAIYRGNQLYQQRIYDYGFEELAVWFGLIGAIIATATMIALVIGMRTWKIRQRHEKLKG